MLGGQTEMQWVILHAIELYTDDMIQHVQTKIIYLKTLSTQYFPLFWLGIFFCLTFWEQIIKSTRER